MARWSLAVIALAIAVAVPSAVSAAWFAKFEGIDGTVEVLPSPAPNSLPQGAGSFMATKAVDAATPKLLEAAVKGKVFNTVVLTLTDAGQTTTTIVLMRVVISSYSSSGGAERFSMHYQSLRSR